MLRIAWLADAAACRLVATLAAERSRLPLWIPVLVGVGIAGYFALPFEPAPALPVIAICTGLAATWRLRSGPHGLVVALALLLIAIGFGAASLRTALVAGPALERKTGPVNVTGLVETIEPRSNASYRVTLVEPVVEGLDPTGTPRRIRISWRAAREAPPPDLQAGDLVRAKAVLMPPPAPAMPGAYDFGRDLWFQGIGATGFAYGAPARVAGREAQSSFAIWLANLRRALGARIAAPLPRTEGAIATALVVGIRGDVPAEVETAWRDSGLTHILSISGLHVSLAAGLFYVVLRGALALVPALALRWPIKKWAAIGGLASAVAYLFLSGADTPVLRSVLMAGIAFAGIVLDRPTISLRMVAWSALVILLVRPESILNVSFQMSFASVTALIAGFDALRRLRRPGQRRHSSAVDLTWRYFGGIAVSTVLASTATLPFGVFHFNRMVNYGLLANLVGVPLTGLIIMPAAMAALLAMPLGLETLPLRVMGMGIGAVDWIAHTVAAMPGAVTNTGAIPMASLCLAVAGGLWISLWSTRWRLAGLLPIGLAAACAIATRPPDLIVDGTGRMVLVAAGDHGWLQGNVRALDATTWLKRTGLAVPAVLSEDLETGEDLSCDGLGCAWRPAGEEGPLVVVARRLDQIAEDCRRARLLVSLEPLRRRCRGPRLVVDRFDLWRGGTHAFWIDRDGSIRKETVAMSRGIRPWSPEKRKMKTRTVVYKDILNADATLNHPYRKTKSLYD